MSWRPNFDDVSRNTELDWCRDVAGEVIDDGLVIAHIALEVEPWWTLAGGHLWWRRWSSGEEHVHGYWSGTDGQHDNWFSRYQDAVSQLFLSDLKSGRSVIRDYDAQNTSADGVTVITSEHKVRWLEEPERSVARRSAHGD